MPDRDDERSRQYRQRAAELRQEAGMAVSKRLRQVLLESADLYERLAQWAEGRKPRRSKRSDA